MQAVRWHRTVTNGRAAASVAETHVLAGDVHQHTLAGDADALRSRPLHSVPARQTSIDAGERAARGAVAVMGTSPPG